MPPRTNDRERSLSGWAYAAFSAIMLVGAVLVGKYILDHVPASGTQADRSYFVLLLLLGIASSLALFGVLKSRASFRGEQFGGVLQLSGPAVVFFLVPVLGYNLTKPPPTFDVYFNLEGLKSADNANETFVIKATIGTETKKLEFNANGQADWRNLPDKLQNTKAVVAIENKSEHYLVPNPRLEATLAEPYVISIVVTPLTEEQARRNTLKSEFQKVMKEIKITFIEKKSLERALDRYIQGPSVDNWAAVTKKASEMTAQIGRGIELATQFDAQFGGDLPDFKPLLANISTTSGDQSKSVDINFSAARQSWEEKDFLIHNIPKELPNQRQATELLNQIQAAHKKLWDDFTKLEEYILKPA